MTGKDATHRAAQLAARQYGRIATAQLVACGLDHDAIEARVEAGWLHPQHRGVYAVGHPGTSERARWIGAQLALGPAAALSHRAAGAAWRIRASDVLDVTVPTLAGRERRAGIVVHRQPLPVEHVCLRFGIRMTTLVRTLLDLAAVLTVKELEDAFEQAQVLHRLQPVALGEQVMLRGGFRGNARLRSLLADAVDPGLVQSRLELHFFKLCRDFGIPRPLTNVAIGPWNVDFLWPAARVIVETDGRRWHATAARRRRDARKQEWLESRGYVVIRLRWADVHQLRAQSAAVVLRALEARRAA